MAAMPTGVTPTKNGATLDNFNATLRTSDVWQQFMRANGKNPASPNLTSDDRKRLQQVLAANGISFAKGMEIDGAGNVNQQTGVKNALKTVGRVASIAAPVIAAPFTGGLSLAAIGAGSGAANAALSDAGLKGILLGAGLGAIPGVGGSGNAARGAGESVGHAIERSLVNPRTITQVAGKSIGGTPGAIAQMAALGLPGAKPYVGGGGGSVPASAPDLLNAGGAGSIVDLGRGSPMRDLLNADGAGTLINGLGTTGGGQGGAGDVATGGGRGAAEGAASAGASLAKTLLGAGAGLVPLLTMLKNGGGNGTSGPFDTNAINAQLVNSLAQQNARMQQAQPAFDALVQMAYGMTPTRYQGAAPAGARPIAPDERAAYRYNAPRFGGAT